MGDLLLLISAPGLRLTQRRLHTPCRPLAGHWIQLSVSHGTFTLIESLGSALLPPVTPRANPPGLTVSITLCLQARSGGDQDRGQAATP